MTSTATGSAYEPARNWREIADYYEREDSKLWQKCYPRIYTGVGGYESQRYIALNLISSIQWVDQIRANASLTAHHVAQVVSRALDYDLPTFFVAREFLAAISQTELPADTQWVDARLPFDAGLLYLPCGALRDPEGTAVNVLGWVRQRQGDKIVVGDTTQMTAAEDCFITIAICEPPTERMYSRGIQKSQSPYIFAPNEFLKSSLPPSFLDMPLTKDDQAFLTQMSSLCFSILLAQTSKPALVTQGQRNGKQSKRAKREFSTPNFIGLNYRARREHQGGTHDSPDPGWRKGHWTHQPVGEYRRNINDFVSAASLPRLADGRINWEAVPDETREAFWRYHEHRWIEPVWVDSELGGQR